MSKIMFRNAGFERGNVNFWESYADAILSAYSTDQKYGSYSGKGVFNTTAIDGLLTSDYHDVMEGEVVKIGAYIRPSGVRWGGIKALEYDGDYSLIRAVNIARESLATAWNDLSGFLEIPSDVEYLRIGLFNEGLSGTDSLLVDALTGFKLDADYVQPLTVEIKDTSTFDASFNTISNLQTLIGCKEYFISVDYTFGAGAADSIVLNVYESDPITNAYMGIGSHTIAAVNTSETHRIICQGAVGRGIYVDCIVTNPVGYLGIMNMSLTGKRV